MTTGYTRTILAIAATSALLLSVSACAPKNDNAASGGDVAADYDPLEGFNRTMFKVNQVLDQIIFKPLATVYRGVVPELARKGVDNFLTNLNQPVVLANSLLQGDVTNAGHTFGKLLTNTLFGAGLFDVAASAGVHNRNEDFGQTLGVWGVDSGPYLVLPIIGPSSGRDFVGRGVDMLIDPINNPWSGWREDGWVYARSGAEGLNFRSENYDIINNLYDNSVDPYSAFRSQYLQFRQAAVENRKSAAYTKQ